MNMNETNMPELPSEELIYRVTGKRSRKWFWNTGNLSVKEINNVLSVIGKSIRDYSRVLDWGCGCGRILLHLKDVCQKIELYGVDIDSEAIAWAQQHIAWAECTVCDGLPPLSFPNGFFDLIYNCSVMTHLDEQYQDAWLDELQRVVNPYGLVLLTVSGDYPFEGLEKTWRDAGADSTPLRETLRKKGILYITDDEWKNGPFPDFYHSTFHAPWYIFEHWGKFFEIKAYIVRGSVDFQDFVLMRRRSEEMYIDKTDLRAEEIKKIKNRLEAGNYEDVNTALTEAIQKYPDSPDLLNLMGMLMLRTGKPEEAAKIFLDIINRWPTYGEASRNLSVAIKQLP
jgi:SAM-dependent methyltransferase